MAEFVGQRVFFAVIGLAVLFVLVGAVADHRIPKILPAIVGRHRPHAAADQPGNAAAVLLGIPERSHERYEIGTVGFTRGA